MDNLLNILFPPMCKFCKKFGYVICPKCLEKTNVLDQQYCLVCGKETFSGFTHETCLTSLTPYRLYSSYIYEGIVRDVIRDSKYNSYEFSLLKKVTEYALSKTLLDIENLKGSYLAPIPISTQKFQKRGFNQAHIICQTLASKLPGTKAVDILERTNDTLSQHTLDRKDRYNNVKDAFRVKTSARKWLQGKDIVLVDDIVTSGATLLETSKTLYANGANVVSCYTLSRKLLSLV